MLSAIGLTLGACSSDNKAADNPTTTKPAATATTTAASETATTTADSDTATSTAGSDTATTTAVTDTPTTDALPDDVDRTGVLHIAYDLVGTSKGGFWLQPTDAKISIVDSGVMYLIHGGLMRKTPAGDQVPDLAESVKIVDANTITMVIRDGETFSDGSPFDGAAVKAGLERDLVSNTGGIAAEFRSLSSVDLTGPNALTLNFPDGTAPSWYDRFLGSWETYVAPANFDPNHPVGAGPMKVTEYEPGQKMVMERRDDYWDSASIPVAGVELINAAGPDATLAAVEAGQADVGALAVSSIPELSGSTKAAIVPTATNLENLALCKKDGPLSDPLFRKAINKAIDRQPISDALYGGAAVPATTLFPEGNIFYAADLADDLSFDLDAAKALLAQSAYPTGASFDLYVLQSAPNPDVAQIIQQDLAQIGVTVNLIQAPDVTNQFLASGVPGAGISPTTGVTITQWTGTSVSNVCGYNDPELEALAAQLSLISQTDPKAVAIWHDIQKIVIGDTLSVILYFGPKTGAYNSDKVGGVAFWQDRITMFDIRGTYIKKS